MKSTHCVLKTKTKKANTMSKKIINTLVFQLKTNKNCLQFNRHSVYSICRKTKITSKKAWTF